MINTLHDTDGNLVKLYMILGHEVAIGIALQKLDWVVQGVISSCSTPGNLIINHLELMGCHQNC